MALFKPKNTNLSLRETLIQNYNQARGNLLLVVVFTLINIALFLLSPLEARYFLVSASIPYILVTTFYELCGKYPAECYAEVYESNEPLNFFDNSFWIGAIVIAFIIIVFYFLCFLLSKKMKSGWLISALVFFSLDTVCLFTLLDPKYFIMDIFFHAWVIVILCMGISASNKLKKLPLEEPQVFADANLVNEEPATTLNGERIDENNKGDFGQQ